jgi:hypothetical protein
MQSVRRSPGRALVAILFVVLAPVLLAADPQPQSPSTPPSNPELAETPALDINQAEIDAGVTPDPAAAPADKSGNASATSAMMMEIGAVLETGRAAIAELAARIDAASDTDARQALQFEAATLKQQMELDILAIQAEHARLAGNQALADRIEADMAFILSPPAPTPPATPRPAPADQR